MRGYRKTAAPTAIGSGGKDNTKQGYSLSHKLQKKATGFGHEIILWPDDAGKRWGVFVWRDSGGGYEAENLTFRGALVRALNMTERGVLRGAPIRFIGDTAATMDRNIGRCGHA